MPSEALHPETSRKPGDTLGRLRSLFDGLVELPIARRHAWLEKNVPDAIERAALLRLLKAHDGAGFLDTPAAQHVARLAPEEIVRAEGLIGQHIGDFRIVRTLGAGGMAAVFLGERSGKDFQQQAAVKLLRRGLYSELEQRLFLRERRVLATLDHANIARMIDGGVTAAGIPYLVMEYIDGVPITTYAQTHRLDLHARLELFLTVCRAVAAAHRSLIVHRDIKPSNILVSGEGVVKLLDFGIAKLIADDTGETTGTVGVFTPGYAAPEQIAGRAITTATDVYGLGVLLHELLLGMRPEGLPTRRPSSLIHTHADTNSGTDAEVTTYPIAAARLRKLLRGDLDNILLKALDPDPAQRYATASSFADDIERHMRRQPVLACPPSHLYRMSKFVQRHRSAVAMVTLFVLGIVAALGVVLWQANVARHQAVRANAMRNYMFSAFEEAEPGAPRAGPPRITEVVEQAIAKARNDTQMNPGVRTELLSEFGAVLRIQGRLSESREELQWNFDRAGHTFGDRDPLTLEAGHQLARTLILTGDYGQARHLLDELFAHAPDGDVSLRSQLLLASANLATRQHEIERAMSDGTQGLQLARKSADDAALAEALSEFGNVQLSANDIHGAIATFQELLANRQKRLGPQHIVVAAAHADLARAWRRAGNPGAAENEIRATLAIDAAVLPKDDWRHANHLNALTMILLAQRDFAAALDAARETLRINRIALGNEHQEISTDLNNVGMLYTRLDDYGAAVSPLREALDLAAAKFGPEHYETATTRANYGAALAMSGNWTGGEAEIRHAIASLEAAREPDVDEITATYEKLARLKLDHDEPEAAIPLLDRVDLLRARISATEPDENSSILRAAALIDLHEPARALPLLDDANTILRQSKNADPLLRLEAVLLQAKAAQALGDHAVAQRYAANGLAQLATLRNPPRRLQKLAADLHLPGLQNP